MRHLWVLFALFGASFCQEYVPGTPGAPWTEEEVEVYKSKLYDIMVRGGGMRSMSKLKDVWPDETISKGYSKMREPNAPKFLRLAFHDCLKYTDGSGGCDGCLNWHNVGYKFGIDGNADAQWLDHEDLYEDLTVSDNNGLELVAKVLEAMYTNPRYPNGTPKPFKVSLKETGKSRADLWALAAIAAVEFGVENNNMACEGPEVYLQGIQPTRSQCTTSVNSTSCKVVMPRSIKFQTGRADCIPDPNAEEPYIATKEERHPWLLGNGESTVEFFERDFGFNGEEMVAIMGAHTFGRLNPEVSLFRYTWTPSQRQLFNNEYYKNIVGGPRVPFDDESDKSCTPVTDAEGRMTQTRWLTSARGQTKNGGPTFWIHENYRCPNCPSADRRMNDLQWTTEEWAECCDNKPADKFCKPDSDTMEEDPDTHKGCEKWAFIYGIDEMALNCEMGLYREFNVTSDGIPYGCHGLEEFKSEHWLDVNNLGNRFRKTFSWSVEPTIDNPVIDNGPALDVWEKIEPECPLNKLRVGGSRPLNRNFEIFARNQNRWMSVFIPTFEKMMANGYKSGDLVDGPNAGITCVRQDPKSKRPVCKKN